jgi:hypothetical protein
MQPLLSDKQNASKVCEKAMDALAGFMGEISLPDLLKVNSAMLQTLSNFKDERLLLKYRELPLRKVV